jgi:hypothetical protein
MLSNNSMQVDSPRRLAMGAAADASVNQKNIMIIKWDNYTRLVFDFVSAISTKDQSRTGLEFDYITLMGTRCFYIFPIGNFYKKNK